MIGEVSMSKRFYWLDILKIIACFFVLTNHTVGYLLQYAGINYQTGLVYCIFFSMCKVGVPIFIMVSGYLLLKSGNVDTYRDVLRKIFRIFVPLFVLSILIFIQTNGVTNFNFFVFLREFLSNPLITPYWYLYMLVGLYIVTPFIQKMIKNFTICDYRMVMILFLVIPSIFPIINVFFDIKISSYFYMAVLPISVGYFITGLYLSKVKLCRRNLIIAVVSYIIFTLCFILFMYVPYLKNGSISYSLDSWSIITTTIPAMALFYIIRYFFENMKERKYLCYIIKNVSLVTFGIYLFHYLINYKIYFSSIIQNVFAFNEYIGIFVLEISCFVLCGIVTFILRKVPVINKFL